MLHSYYENITSSSSSGTPIGIRDLHKSTTFVQPWQGCHTAAPKRPRMALLLLVIPGHDSNSTHTPQHLQHWLAVANRKAYSLQHGVPLYLVHTGLGSSQHPAWEKLLALQAVFQHSCAHWVWTSDADAYIMNLPRNVLNLAAAPLQHRHPSRRCNTSTPDIIAAGACLSTINTGSMLWRNTNWTRQFVSDAWGVKDAARPFSMRDQAAVQHLYQQQADTRQHVCVVKGRSLNAFPNTTTCHDGGGTYKVGGAVSAASIGSAATAAAAVVAAARQQQ